MLQLKGIADHTRLSLLARASMQEVPVITSCPFGKTRSINPNNVSKTLKDTIGEYLLILHSRAHLRRIHSVHDLFTTYVTCSCKHITQ